MVPMRKTQGSKFQVSETFPWPCLWSEVVSEGVTGTQQGIGIQLRMKSNMSTGDTLDLEKELLGDKITNDTVCKMHKG
jgi:hypothetical protein